MRRLFYLALGAAVGVLLTRRLSRLVQAWTPAGLAGRAIGLSGTVREFADDIRAAMSDREAELRAALGIDDAVPDRERHGS